MMFYCAYILNFCRKTSKNLEKSVNFYLLTRVAILGHHADQYIWLNSLTCIKREVRSRDLRLGRLAWRNRRSRKFNLSNIQRGVFSVPFQRTKTVVYVTMDTGAAPSLSTNRFSLA